MIVAGIVLYNPQIKRLAENIEAIKNQVSEVIMFDNGSSNIEEIEELVKKYDNVTLLKGKENKGIAYALNQLANKALFDSKKWLLTLDQDSVVNKNIIKTYQKYMNLPHLGQLSCLYEDRNRKQKDLQEKEDATKIKYSITSGSLINLTVLKEIGGFDSDFFIDWVDMELCCALRSYGYETYQVNELGFIHELGHPTSFNFFGFKGYTSNYPAFRYYYKARNSIDVAYRYPKEEKVFIRVLAQVKALIKINLYEKNKLKKSKAILEGIRDGIRLKNKVRGNYLNQ